MKKIIVAFVTAALVGLLVWQQSPKQTSQSLPSLPTLSLDVIAQFEIKRQGEILIQAKRDKSDWLMVEGDAPKLLKTSLVTQLLTDMVNMQPKRVASTKAKHHARFSVGDGATQLTLSDTGGNRLLSILVGKPATDLRSTYLRIVGEDTVLTVDKVLTWQVNRTATAWFEEGEELEESTKLKKEVTSES